MAGCGHSSAVVLGIVDATNQYAEGGKKDSEYIAQQFLPFLRKHDPDKVLTDCIFFDGARDVQKAGKIIQQEYPNVAVIHGVEHICALFARDICKLAPIRMVIDKYILLYKTFGSGMRHQCHAIFKKFSTEHNDGRYLGLLRPTEVRFAGYFIALHRLLRNKKALKSTIASAEFDKHKFSGRHNHDLKSTIINIVNDEFFWREVTIIVIAMFPLLQILRLADSNQPGMDKAYFYARQTTKVLNQLVATFDGSEEDPVFNARSDPEEMDLDSFELDDSDSESDDGYISDSSYVDVDIEEEESLGTSIIKAWEKRFKSIATDYAILGWFLSVQPDVYEDAKNYTTEEVDALKRALKQIWLPYSNDGEWFEERWSAFWVTNYNFRHQLGDVYQDEHIFHDQFVKTGESYKWHHAHWSSETEVFSKVGARVCSKILGIGASERCWGDVKQILGEKRRKMKSEKLEKQTLIYTTHAINDARKRNHRKEDRWQEWDNKVEEFNRSLMKQKIGMLSPASLDTLRAQPK